MNDAEFLDHIEARVREAKKDGFNAWMKIDGHERVRLHELATNERTAVHSTTGNIGCDYALYEVEVARAVIVNAVKARLKS